MAIPRQIDAQRDFSAGELDPTSKRRDDDAFVRTGMRQLSNARTLNAGGVTQRPGRNLVAKRSGIARDEDVLMAPGVTYRLSFTNAALTIYDASGAQVFTEAGRAWTGATLGQIVYAVYLKQVFVTFPGVIPEVLTWDGVTTWTSAAYAELVLGNQKRTPFYRLAAQGITMAPGAATGAGITLATSAAYFVAGMVGTRIRYVGRQILITSVTNPGLAHGTVEEPLPGSQSLDFGPVICQNIFAVGDIVRGSISEAEGVVIGFGGGTAPGGAMSVQLLTLGTSTGIVDASPAVEAFIGSDVIVSSAGSGPIIGVAAIGAPQPIAVWDEEVMNTYRGWPRSVTSDQGRLIFSDFPSVPNGIAWSALGSPTDLNVGALPSEGFFELVPGKNRVLYVVPGMDGTEFVFCDNGLFHIPIGPTNPLKPGSVAFLMITGDGAAQVQPRRIGGVILFVDQGLNQLQAIIATGSYSRFYEIAPLTDLHAHLFNNIQAIALPTSVTQFPERYAYVLNGDGTIAVGKYMLKTTGELAGKIGWVPWNGAGSVEWVSALNDIILFVTSYTSGATAFMVETLDATQYLDASLAVNAIPTPLTPPGGKGPLWWLPGVTVELMDGTLDLGPHATDANGFLIPISPGEDLTSATLAAGFTWTAVWEPFVPAAQPGQDQGQRMKKRRAIMEAYVIGSTGFRFASLFSGELRAGGPALGDIVSDRRIPAYNTGDDATLPPPLREQAYRWNPLGRAHDPRGALIKDTPGPFTLVEVVARVNA